MSVRTGESEQGLKKIADLTRGVAIVLIVLHIYYVRYSVFQEMGYISKLSDNILRNIAKTGLFRPAYKAKIFAITAMAMSLLGTVGKKDVQASIGHSIFYLSSGILIYFGCTMVAWISVDNFSVLVLYSIGCAVGLILFVHGGSRLARLIKIKIDSSVFNDDNETFPQEERTVQNKHSVHFTTRYRIQERVRPGKINIVNPFRGTLLVGNPGSGKTRWLVKPMIVQQIQKQFAMVIFDFKYPNLTSVAYGAYLKYKSFYAIEPEFLKLNLDSPFYQCNPLMPESMKDISDAAEASQTTPVVA